MLLIGCLISVLANLSGIYWQLLLLVEETGVPRENKQPVIDGRTSGTDCI